MHVHRFPCTVGAPKFGAPSSSPKKPISTRSGHGKNGAGDGGLDPSRGKAQGGWTGQRATGSSSPPNPTTARGWWRGGLRARRAQWV
ncbi:hypothetical protein ACLOJK_014075 [Asimina triloba]